jgi:NADPH:quinone reductase-like Zn-dependent oxidoreductase
MHAVSIDRFGGPAVLKRRIVAVPTPGPTDVLIAVHTTGVAVWDAEMREGFSPGGKPPFPWILGTDGSGTIAAVGARVRGLEVGDRVYASTYLHQGFYADFVVASAASTALIPSTLDLAHAGAIPITGTTALDGVARVLKVRKGERVVIHGASGGLGSLAVQFARHRGARVLATATGTGGIAFVRRLGADEVVDGHRDDLTEVARAFAPDGVDAILALVGGEALTALSHALRPGGRLAHPNGVEPKPRKRHGIEILAYDGVGDAAGLARLARAVDAGKVKVRIGETFPLADAAAAHRRLAEGGVLGKIVLRVR